MQNIWQQLPQPILMLAPMEDVTDTVFRQLMLQWGKPELMFTEFTSVEGMLSAGAETVKQRLIYQPSEHPLIAQIWGKTPEAYYEGTKEIVRLGFAGVDINMGCPVKKIVKQGACSALIDNEPLAREVITATLAAADGKIPVSVKTRLGFSYNRIVDWAEFLLGFDIAALTIHGRVAKHMSKYPANWEEIAKAVEIRNRLDSTTLIIGNGDVLSRTEAEEKAAKYGLDGIMIGRGIFHDPLLFNAKKSIYDLTKTEKLQMLLQHTLLFQETWQGRKNFNILKRFYKIYVRDFEDAAELRAKLMQTNSLPEVEELIAT